MTTWRSFSAAVSFTPGFSTTASRPPLKLICVTSPSSPRLQSVLRSTSTAPTQKKNTLPCYVLLLKEVGGQVCVLLALCCVMWCVLVFLCFLSTLELVHFRALRVHVRVIQRVARGVADGRRRVLQRRVLRRAGARVVRVVLERVRAGVQAQVGEPAGRVAAIRGVAVAQVLQVHEPLGPEAPADALAVHGQVDELTWRGQMGE